MGEHREHVAGTVSGCRHCVTVAYEPSWYATLLAFAEGRDVVRLEAAHTVGP